MDDFSVTGEGLSVHEPVLEEILRTGRVRSVGGTETLALDSAIDEDLGNFLGALIRQRKPKITLEVGLAFGVSTLFICEALRSCGGERHIAIDAYQSGYWKGIGVNNVKLAGYDDLIEVHESFSHLALAELEARGTRADFAFIDGWHTFDHTLTDFFHVDRILQVGGIVALDNVSHFDGVHQVARFIARNRAYRTAGTSDNVAAYRPSLGARFLRTAGRCLPLARKALQSKFLVPDEHLGFTPACRCVAFEKLAEDTRHWADHHDF